MQFGTGFLKFFYRALITGLPITTYNSYSGVRFHSPATVLSSSTYVNYKLTSSEFDYLNNHLSKTTNDLEPKKISLDKNEEVEDHYLSINMYNCTSPMFSLVSKSPITRCEINTYVMNKKKEYGTLIMDYSSNYLSIDPDNIFKFPDKTSYTLSGMNQIFKAQNQNFDFFLNYTSGCKDLNFTINEQLIYFTDKIFYNNGLYDKLYYDTSLVLAKAKIPKIHNISFKFFDLELKKPESIFYFNDNLQFVCSMWDNLEHL